MFIPLQYGKIGFDPFAGVKECASFYQVVILCFPSSVSSRTMTWDVDISPFTIFRHTQLCIVDDLPSNPYANISFSLLDPLSLFKFQVFIVVLPLNPPLFHRN